LPVAIGAVERLLIAAPASVVDGYAARHSFAGSQVPCSYTVWRLKKLPEAL
jgi:hypothetical protein